MKLTLGLSLLLTGSALADTKYTIKSGDTIERIAKKFGVKERSLKSYNGLSSETILKIGRTIAIPTSSKSSSTTSDRQASVKVSGGYTVRNGDHDWTIAKKHGISVEKLHAMNPSVKWRSLQIGSKLNVPGAPKFAVVKSAPKLALPKASGKYAIREGDNDWLVARRFSTTPKVIRQLNPDVRWDRLQIGTSIRVPGATAVAAKKSSAPQLKSRYAVVTGNDVMVREKPTSASDAKTKVQAGTRVTVLYRENNWYKLRFPHGTAGWVRGDFLKATSAPVRVAKVKKPAKISKPHKQTKLAVVQRDETDSGYIQQPVVAPQQKKGQTVEKIMSKAQSLRGVRYRWGGASRSGTDCSGFTTQVFKSNGISLPRTSGAQSKVGKPVSRKDLQKGDLVFFKTTRSARVSHVGIYIGNGKFIHASSGGGRVMESSLSDGYYNNRFVTARRMIRTKSSPKDLAQELPNLPSLGEISDPDPVTNKPAGQ
ncbi:MAG: NlpC/P60 family protein [Fimbriimonas sp.]